MNEFKDIILLLQKNGIKLHPLSQDEYARVVGIQQAPLPKVYTEFLLTMGRNTGAFMLGSSAFYSDIFELQEYGEELLAENNFMPLPPNAFVFWMHQGYQLAFFILGEGDNPPVYFFSEGKKQTDFMKESSLLSFYSKQLLMSGIE